MSLLDIFKKKPSLTPPFPEPAEEMPTGPPTDIPLESVLIMQQQGLTNPQIIQSLQRQGYTLPLVAEALRQSEVRASGGEAEPITRLPPTQEQPSSAEKPPSISEDTITQIQKTLSDTREELKSLQTLRTTHEEKITDMEKNIETLQAELKTIHQAVFAQIQEYNKTLKGVGTEIIAMEKVFSEALPELTGNIQELQRVTRDLKGEEKPVRKIPKSPSAHSRFEGS